MAFGQFLFHWALDFASVVQFATMVTIVRIGVVFVARIIEGTKITPSKIISGIGAFLGIFFYLLTDTWNNLVEPVIVSWEFIYQLDAL